MKFSAMLKRSYDLPYMFIVKRPYNYVKGRSNNLLMHQGRLWRLVLRPPV